MYFSYDVRGEGVVSVSSGKKLLLSVFAQCTKAAPHDRKHEKR